MLNKFQRGSTAANLLFIAFWLAIVGGWIANIVKLIGMIDGDVTTMFVLRVVGIFAVPFGTILGFL